jgi:tRNA-specific 2-thiouridylase
MNHPPKAVSLISGGLDSMLATKAIMEQGIHVEGINFYTGFCVEGHTHAIRKQERAKPKRNNALWVAEQLGIKLHIIDIVEEYKDTVIKPKHGYGSNLNPCLDCKIFMIRRAKQWMDENGFDFIITGEVIGQRPMSQTASKIPIVAKESGALDRIVRPLCGQFLPETLPEREGWIDRQKLFNFSGRSRKPQMALAKQYGIEEYAQPAGGCCFLTNPEYSKKLQDLWDSRGERNYELDDIMLLKLGRHIRPRPHFKLIIGREEGENNFMSGYKSQFTHLSCVSHIGPLALVDGKLNPEDRELAARILARYTQGRDEDKVNIQLVTPDGVAYLLPVTPLKVAEIEERWHV